MFALLAMLFLIAMLWGMIWPRTVIPWGQARTRERAAMVYGTGMLASMGMCGITYEPPTDAEVQVQQETQARVLEEKRRDSVMAGLAAARQVVWDKKRCSSPKDISSAWEKIRVAQRSDPEHAEAKNLTNELERCRKSATEALAAATASLMLEQRRGMAKRVDTLLLDRGIDADVRVTGQQQDQLVIKWPLMGRVFVHKFTNGGSTKKGEFLSNIADIGFRRVTFANSSGDGVKYDLEVGGEADAEGAFAAMGLGERLDLPE